MFATTHRGRVQLHVHGYGTTMTAAVAAGARWTPARRVRLDLCPDVAAPATARAAVNRFCRAWGLDALAGDAEIIVSELVANVVAHAGTAMTVVIALSGRYLHLVVRDGSGRRPQMHVPSAGTLVDEGGRGLYLVQRLALRWGCRAGRTGKSVWATLRRPVAAPAG